MAILKAEIRVLQAILQQITATDFVRQAQTPVGNTFVKAATALQQRLRLATLLGQIIFATIQQAQEI